MRLPMLKEKLSLSDFDYNLPKELIAQYPAVEREDSRLLVLERGQKRITHGNFKDIVKYLSPGDCLVLNNTKVIYARLLGKREKQGLSGGGKQEIFLLENISADVYRVLAKPARKLTKGTRVLFDDGRSEGRVLSDQGMVKVIKFSGNGQAGNIWQRMGQVPLPPYIKRPAEDLDQQRYQTVYAQEEGSCAAPTAGLHFSQGLLQDIADQGVQIAHLTLHINYGTFAPVKCEDVTQHQMHKEYFALAKKTKEIIKATRAKGKRVLAVGTTSVRVLETKSKQDSGWTDLFIYPPYQFKMVDGLLTNFHFPKSTLLMLVSAFAGKDLLFDAYQEAIKQRYRFFSYGDAMLII